MAANSRGQSLLAKSAMPILAVGAIALAGGLVWVAVGGRTQDSPPATNPLQDDQHPQAPAAQGASSSQTFAVLGDDYAQAEKAGWAQGWVLRLSDEMCWGLSKASVQTGTGFVAALQPGAMAYPQRVDGLGSGGAQVILVQGGTNDYLAPSEQITAAADATFKALRQQNPNSRVIAIGPVVVPHRAEARELARVSTAIAAAAQGNGVLYIDPVAEHWLDQETLFDGVVPNSDGYVEYARRLKADLAQAGMSSSCKQAAP
jgi:GDSL-like Lipase/Acylhydrolase family